MGGKLYWFGDSIGVAWPIVGPEIERDAPVYRLRARLRDAGSQLQVGNMSVGGMGVHQPTRSPGDIPAALDWVKAHMPADADQVVVALGANDVGSHKIIEEYRYSWAAAADGVAAGDARYVYYWQAACVELDQWLSARVGRVFWQSILPFAVGEYCTEDQGPLAIQNADGTTSRRVVSGYSTIGWNTARIKTMNGWARQQFAGRWFDVSSAMRPTAGFVGDARLYVDGLHPTQWGLARIADQIPLAPLMAPL